MTPLVLIRHAPTVWNAQGRLQGQTDIPLSEEGRSTAGSWHIPEAFHGFDFVVSPLQRCVETAQILFASMPVPPTPRIDPRLVEMCWGDWEGRTVTELRLAEGDELVANEGRGLDFRPPGGESPRDVQQRIRPFLIEIGASGRPTLAVLHRGVMRAVYSVATGWDMRDKPPHRLLHKMPHGNALVFDIGDDGKPHLRCHEVPLVGAAV